MPELQLAYQQQDENQRIDQKDSPLPHQNQPAAVHTVGHHTAEGTEKKHGYGRCGHGYAEGQFTSC